MFQRIFVYNERIFKENSVMNIIDIMPTNSENIAPNILQYFRQLILDGKAKITKSDWTEHSFAIRQVPDIHHEHGHEKCWQVNFIDLENVKVTLWNANYNTVTNTRCYWNIQFIDLQDNWLQLQYHTWISNEAIKQFEFEESVKRNKRINKIAQDLRNKFGVAPITIEGETK